MVSNNIPEPVILWGNISELPVKGFSRAYRGDVRLRFLRGFSDKKIK